MRRRPETNLVLRHSGLEMNRIDHSVRRDGEAIALTNKEFALLEFLLLHRGSCISRVTLLDRVWKSEAQMGTNVVDVYVNYLRRKLHDSPPDSIIQTVRGRGYCIPARPLAAPVASDFAGAPSLDLSQSAPWTSNGPRPFPNVARFGARPKALLFAEALSRAFLKPPHASAAPHAH